MEQEIHGYVLLRKVTPIGLCNNVAELFCRHIEITLVSSDVVDTETRTGKTYGKGKVEWNPLTEQLDVKLKVTFKWSPSLGVPGAFLIKNRHYKEFFLRFLMIELPDKGSLQFRCNSWIFPSKGDSQRIFFSNKSYLPSDTPRGLQELRMQDMVELRGNGTGERRVRDRIYDYDFYNDLGMPDLSSELKRPVLGGSSEFPYPRRCRTGRPPSISDPSSESRALYPLFIPPDERFPLEDFTDFGAHTLTSFTRVILPIIQQGLKSEFESFDDVEDIYAQDITIPGHSKSIFSSDPLKHLINLCDPSLITRLEIPDLLSVNSHGWSTDEEFARETLAGLNPLVIQCLKEFPPASKLDPQQYGPQKSTVSADHIQKYLEGLSVEEALAAKKLFIIDYYDVYMPYVERINNLSSHSHKGYATRTFFYLDKQGMLQPVAIELCLPPTVDRSYPLRQVCTPAEQGTEEGALWLLAKAHARGNDSGYHQLVSHWLTTHCVMEPIIIATHRQLSRMHPLFKLLLPHYLNTMDINEAARVALICAFGIIENGFTPGKYCMEMSSKAYKGWKFVEQGMPADLLKRGMAVTDPKAPHGLRLVIEDYPFAVDGLEIWFALKTWVSDFVNIFYKTDGSVKADTELQAWWEEIVKVGHGDLQHDPSVWYQLVSRGQLIEALTTLIWTASAHHSAVNFGQYPYAGFMPNVPTMTRRLLPQKGTKEYAEMLKDVEDYYLKTVTDPLQTLIVTSVLHVLASHAKNEVYIGQLQGSTPEWTAEKEVEDAFRRLSAALVEIEKNVDARNKNPKLPNRIGPTQVPYTLLYPDTSNLSRKGGITGRGVPNSVSI